MPAYFHLLEPTLSHPPLTDSPINKPTKVASLKFPCRTILPDVDRALPYLPAGSVLLGSGPVLESHEEKHLTFNIYWDVPPPLFKALYGFRRNTQ